MLIATLTDIEIIRTRLQAITSDVSMIHQILDRLEERHKRKGQS
jgi:hypothetical protein